MAEMRAVSLDAAIRRPNPFWSSTTRANWEIQRARPRDLPAADGGGGWDGAELPPVPGDEMDPDLDTRSSRGRSPSRTLMDRPKEIGETSAGRGRSMALPFATPASWMSLGSGKGKAVKSEGKMPDEDSEVPRREGDVRRALQEAGERQTKRARGHLDARVQEDLDRAMEREMFLQLQEENLKLRAELEEANRKKTDGLQSSDWSEVSAAHQTTGMGRSLERILYTPNGTRVPDDPPPDEPEQWQVPPWPLDAYEVEEVRAPCSNVFTGYRGRGPVQLMEPQHGVCQGGPPVRQEHRERFNECGGGPRARQAHQQRFKECGGGPGARYGHQDEEEQWKSPAENKTMWLERELVNLRQRLDEQVQGNVMRNSEYWNRPFVPTSSQGWFAGSASGNMEWGHGLLQQDDHGGQPGDRAWHAEQVQGDVPELHQRDDYGCQDGDRAWQGGQCHGDDSGQRHGDDPGRRRDDDRRQVQGDLHGQVCGEGQKDSGHAPGDGRVRDGGVSQDNNGGNQRRQDNDKGGQKEEVSGRKGHKDKGDDEWEDNTDNLKSVNVKLPALPPHTGKESGIACGDWLVEVRPLIGDLTAGALQWWDDLMMAVGAQYNQWLLADPLQRLNLPPPADVEYNTSALRKRLDIRTSTLLLAALPSALKSELVAARHMSSGEILYRIMRNYQPGGLAEKSETLQALSMTLPAKSPREATEQLQRWRRHQLRARELGASLPDASILCKALGVIASEVLLGAPQASFRLNSFRLQSRLDVLPTAGNLEQFYQMLLAEMETLALCPEGGSMSLTTPTIKSLQQPQGQPGGGKGERWPCRSWGTTTGCRFGKSCRFEHAVLPDARDRCWQCSSPDHQKQDCPYKPTLNPPAAGSSGGSGGGMDGKGPGGGSGKGQPGSGKGKGKVKSKGNNSGKGVGKEENKPTNPTINKVQPETEEKSGKGAAPGGEQTTGEGNPKDVGRGGNVAQGAQGETGSTQALVSEVTSLLKSLRMGQPQLSAIRVKRLDKTNAKTTLLDGGATHCLRPMKDELEWESAQECRVALASGFTSLRMVPNTHVLITREKETQRIIPIRELVRMGIRVQWDQDRIEMTRHDGRKLPVWLDEGCPVVADSVGVELMQEKEKNNERAAGMMKVIRKGDRNAGQDLCSEGAAEAAAEIAGVFREVPLRISSRIPGADEADLDMAKIPFNRRQRKRIMEANTRILHLFSGESSRCWMDVENENLVVVNVELERGQNLLDDQLFGWLELLAREGLWDQILAGPPCRTVSLARHRGDGGPRPLRSRDGEQRWGLSWNTGMQQAMVDGDSLLWLRTLWLCYLAKIGNPKTEMAVEQPEDPELWLPLSKPRPPTGFPSYLKWPETHEICRILQIQRSCFDQGALGHEKVKPTNVLTDMPEIIALHRKRAPNDFGQVWSEQLDERLIQSKQAAKWAPGLVDAMKEAIRRKGSQSVWGPRPGTIRRHPEQCEEFLRRRSEARERLGLPPLPDETMALRAINPQLEEWKRHVINEHQPSRRDCAECLRAMGRSRPHHRNPHVQAYSLNVDVAGPYPGGHDQGGLAPRYFMVGVYTLPVKEGEALVESLQEMGGGREPGEREDLRQRGEELLRADREGEGQQPEIHPQGRKESSEDELERLILGESKPKVPLGQEDLHGDDDQGEKQPVIFVDREEKADEVLPEALIRDLDIRNKQWEEYVQDLSDVRIQNITMAVPLRSRHVNDVTRAVSYFYAKVKSLGVPLHRIHSDRAKEFVSKQFAAWVAQRGLLHTTTAGDEHQGCARVEGEIGHLKNRVRVLLTSTNSGEHLWPLALRHAAECRYRSQLRSVGVPAPTVLPFGVSAMSRVKRWHSDKLQHPMAKVTVYGPAHDMSLTSGGYYVNCDGKWMRTTVIVVPNFSNQSCRKVPELELPQDDEEGMEYAPTTPGGDEIPLEIDVNEDGLELRQPLEMQEIPEEPQQLTHRLRGKQTVPRTSLEPSKLTHRLHGKQADPRVMAVLRIGGEWSDGNNSLLHQGALCGQGAHGDQGALCKQGVAINKLGGQMEKDHGGVDDDDEMKRSKQRNNETAMALMQLKNLRKCERDERAMMNTKEDAEMVMNLQRQCEELESHLCALQHEEVKEDDYGASEETLVSKNIPIEEVRKDLAKWKEAMVSEYESLIQHGAISPIDEMQYNVLKDEKNMVSTIPGMMVSVLKPPQRRKARFVACGNYMTGQHEKQEVSAGGLDAIVVRTMISVATNKPWSIGTADVRTAFLQAPRRETGDQCTVINPPTIVKEANILKYGWKEKWLVRKALYGLVESPKDWAIYRDQQLKTLNWTTKDGKKVKLEPTVEAHLWMIKDVETEEHVAYVGIYVDDVLVVGGDDILKEMMHQLTTIFQMSPYDQVRVDHPVTFCGYEIYKEDGGYGLRQEKYIEELLLRRGVEGEEGQPLPKIQEGEDEEYHDPKVVKEVQAIVGELQWLATRTRPDLSYATAFAARLVHRRPAYALKLCHYLLRYLARYPKVGLWYEEEDYQEEGQRRVLHVKADTSFGPPHEQYRSVQGVAIYLGGHLLLWTSSRQAFVTLSTAECELLGYTEGLQCAETIASLLELLQFKVSKVLEGDSRAALAQIQNDGGSWRTRHLRLRAWRLREVMMDVTSTWSAQHCAGAELAADGLTKALGGQAHRKFLQLLGMRNSEIKKEQAGDGGARVQALRGEQGQGQRMMEHAATALASAGTALAIGSENRSLGVVLLLSSVAVGCLSKKGLFKDQEGVSDEESKQETRKSQDPETRKDQDPEIRKFQEIENSDKNEKEEEGGTSRDEIKKEAYGTCRQNSKWSFEEEGQEISQAKSWEVEGCCPGLRAFRMNKDGSGGASSAMDGASTSHAAGLRRGSAALRGKAALQSSSSDGVTTEARTYGMSRSGEVEMDQYRDDGPQGEGRPGDEGQGEVPWILEKYQHPPAQGSADAWEVGLMKEGWLVRHHKKSRKRLFIPLHQSLPIDPTRLSTERITVRMMRTGARIVTLDDWRMSKRTSDDREWRGYTFFKLVEEENMAASSSSGPTTRITRSENETSPNDEKRTKTVKKEDDHHDRGSGYEGVWSPDQEMVKGAQDRFGSLQIPTIKMEVTVNNYVGGQTTSSNRSTPMEDQMPIVTTSWRRTTTRDADPPSNTEVFEDVASDDGSYSFVGLESES